MLHLLSAPTTSHSHPTYRPRDSHTHTVLVLFAQIHTQRSAALLGIYLTHICALFKLTCTLAACDWATARMMKISWTVLSPSGSDLHGNFTPPSLSPTVTLHTTQIFPECHCCTCIEVELRSTETLFTLMVHSKVQISVCLGLSVNVCLCSFHFFDPVVVILLQHRCLCV